MPDYPGVDPDGLKPGGLQIAGKVNAGALAVLGNAVNPSVFGWGVWLGDTGVVIPHGTAVDLPLDTEDKPFADIGFSNPDTKLTFNKAGTYLGLAAFFQNSGTATSGFPDGKLLLSAGYHWDEIPQLPHDLAALLTMYALIICDVAAGATISAHFNNALDVDANFGCEVMIARLV